MNRRILVAWEHGRNLGHISRMRAVSQMIEIAGSTPVWVVPPSHLEARTILESGYEVYAGPLIRGLPAYRKARVDSFAEILLQLGFSEPTALKTLVQNWMNLMARIGPDRVVLDYAPAAQLAAWFLDIQAFQITNGFDAPPPQCPIFGLSARGPYIENKNEKSMKILASTLEALTGCSPDKKAPNLKDYFLYSRKIYDCIPEADPYSARSDGIYIGPLAAEIKLSNAPQNPWSDTPPASQKHKIFAYLREIPDPIDLLDAFSACDADTLCVWPDIPEHVLSRHRSASVRVVRDAVPMTEVLTMADAVVNYGSATTVNKTLLMGKPQLMIPHDMEKIMISKAIERNGAGLVHNGKNPYQAELMDLVTSQAMRKAAADISRKYDDDRLLSNRRDFLAALVS